jgi:hypothetical protein
MFHNKAMINRREAFLQTEMEESLRFFLTVAVIAAHGNVLRLVIAVRFADKKLDPITLSS